MMVSKIKSKSTYSLSGERGGTGKGGEGLEHVVPRPNNDHAHSTLISCLAPALVQETLCCIVSRTAGGMARQLRLPIVPSRAVSNLCCCPCCSCMQGGCMYAFQLFDTQMYRHMEAICPETSLEQRAMALASTRIHPAEVAAAPVIGYLPHGAPIMVVRGMAVGCGLQGAWWDCWGCTACKGSASDISHAMCVCNAKNCQPAAAMCGTCTSTSDVNRGCISDAYLLQQRPGERRSRRRTS